MILFVWRLLVHKYCQYLHNGMSSIKIVKASQATGVHRYKNIKRKPEKHRSMWIYIKVVFDDYLYINIGNTYKTGCPLSKKNLYLNVFSDKFQASLGCILTAAVKDVAKIFCPWGAKITAGHTKTSRNLIHTHTYVICACNKHNTQYTVLHALLYLWDSCFRKKNRTRWTPTNRN